MDPLKLALLAEAAFTAHYLAMARPKERTKAKAGVMWRESSQARDLWTGIVVAVLDGAARVEAPPALPGLGLRITDDPQARCSYASPKLARLVAASPVLAAPYARPTPPGLAVMDDAGPVPAAAWGPGVPDATLADGTPVDFKSVDIALIEQAYAADPRPTDPEALRAWKNRWFGYHYGRPLKINAVEPSPEPKPTGITGRAMAGMFSQLTHARIERQKLAHIFLELNVTGPLYDGADLSGVTRKAFRAAAERHGLGKDRTAQIEALLPEADA